MANHAKQFTQKELEALERKVRRTYKQAGKEIKEKLESFKNHHAAKDAVMQQKLADGLIDKVTYASWLRGQVFQGELWQAKLDDITHTYMNADKAARAMVGESSKGVFMESANYAAYEIEQKTRGAVSFTLYNRAAVNRIIKDNPQILPKWKIDEKKDYIWNAQRVRKVVTQGIIQGESIHKIGEHLTDQLSASNGKKMVMFARTAMVGAQNAGHVERMHEAQDMGIEVKKQWMAILDNRVRDAHRDLNGVIVDVDKPFETELGPIMFPGDPTADPANVYNCRCTMVDYYPKYPKQSKPQESYAQYVASKQKQATAPAPAPAPKQTPTPTFTPKPKPKPVTRPTPAPKPTAQPTPPPTPTTAPTTAPITQPPKQAAPTPTTVTPPTSYQTTEEWINACKSNPSTSEILAIEDKNVYTKEQERALERYTGSAYEKMNALNRYLATGMTDEEVMHKLSVTQERYNALKEDIRLCHDAINNNRLQQDRVFRRGTDVGDIAGLFMQGDFSKNKMMLEGMSAKELNAMFQGAVGTYAGFTSSSSQWDKGFWDNVEILINAPKGTAATSIMKISNFGTGEGETLFRDYTNVVCDKIEEIAGSPTRRGSIRVFLTVIPD